MVPLAAVSELRPVGGNDPAASWTALLAIGAVIVAVFQGALPVESSDPTRISYKKFRIMIALEILEVAIVVTSESLSYIQMKQAFEKRWHWLHWMSPCILAIGLLEVLNDAWFTINVLIYSRIKFIPISSIRRSKGGKWSCLLQVMQLLPIGGTLVCSAFLALWCQRSILLAPSVDSASSAKAAMESVALSNGVFGFCIAWGLLLTGGWFIITICLEIYHGRKYPWIWLEFLAAWKPHEFITAENRDLLVKVYGMSRNAGKIDEGLIQEFDRVHMLEHERVLDLSNEEKRLFLEIAPNHIGNTIVGRDRIISQDNRIFHGLFSADNHVYHTIVLFVEHFSILPLQISTVWATWYMHDKLDEEGFNLLSEIVNSVFLVAVIELGIALKTWFWGFGYSDSVHKNDRTADELLHDAGKSTALRQESC